jgi:sarcosine oxidase subunit gamma
MLEHQQPFDSLLQGDGTDFASTPGIRMAWLSGWEFLLLQSRSEAALQDALMSQMGLRLPTPRTTSSRDDCALLWLTPTEWLLASRTGEIEALRAALAPLLASCLAVATDMSDALAVCEVSGARCAEVLMSGCTLDLRADAFGAGRSARTGLADIPAVLWNPGEESQRIRCIVDRSHAAHLHEWLTDAAGLPRPLSAVQ